jgi:hypothetical protein
VGDTIVDPIVIPGGVVEVVVVLLDVVEQPTSSIASTTKHARVFIAIHRRKPGWTVKGARR